MKILILNLKQCYFMNRSERKINEREKRASLLHTYTTDQYKSV